MLKQILLLKIQIKKEIHGLIAKQTDYLTTITESGNIIFTVIK